MQAMALGYDDDKDEEEAPAEEDKSKKIFKFVDDDL